MHLDLTVKFSRYFDRFWKFTDSFDFEILLSRAEKPFINHIPVFDNEEINQSYERDNQSIVHYEHIKRLSANVLIEPQYCYCIVWLRKIVLSGAFYPRFKPSFLKVLFSYFSFNRTNCPRIIIFDGHVGTNYFHFFTDILNKIWLINKIPGYEHIPILIGHNTFKTHYFQYLIKNTRLKDFNWQVQKENQFIKSAEVYFVRPMPYGGNYYKELRGLLDLPYIEVNRKIFLTRNSQVGRYLDNFNEIKTILDRYHFETVDTDLYSFDDQMKLFGSVKYLIAIHGAGLTNIIFSDQQIKILEINPGNRIGVYYYWLSTALNVKYYDVMLGGPLPKVNDVPEKGFYLNPLAFEDALKRLLD